MTFIHPLLLGGLLLAGIPVLIHLIMRQKPKRLQFPAFQFLLQKHRTNQRSLRLRHILLLALRIALIVAMCLALARPLVRGLLPLGEQPAAVVVLIDTSYSMEYAAAGGKTRLDEAKERALEILKQLPNGSRVAILDSADAGGDESLTLDAARHQIGELKLRHANAPLNQQIIQAYGLFSKLEQNPNNPDEPLPRFLYIFSDRTAACWDPSAAGSQKPPEGLQIAFVDVAAKDPEDTAIVSVEALPAVVAAGNPVEIRVTIRATGKTAKAQFVCQFDDDEKNQMEAALEIAVGTSKSYTFLRPTTDGSGQTSIAPGSLKPGLHQVRVRLRATDALPFNNKGYATFAVRDGRRVLVIADDPGDAHLWSDALNANPLFLAEVKSTAQAAELRFKDYAVVCLLDVANPKPLWQNLAEYVKNGGRLAVVPGGEGWKPDLASYNDDADARELLPGRLERVVEVATEDQADSWWSELLPNSTTAHPFLTKFRQWRKRADIDFFQEGSLPWANRFWQVRDFKDDEVIVHYAKGDLPALLERRDVGTGKGHVLLFTTAFDAHLRDDKFPWNNYNSNLSFYFVLVNHAVGYLAGDTKIVELNRVCGQNIDVELPASSRLPLYTLQGPGLSTSESTLPRAGDQDKLIISGDKTATPGNYTVIDSDKVLIGAFSVNSRSEESLLEPVPVEQIENVLGPGSVVLVGQDRSLREALQGQWNQPVNLLPWLLIAVLLALAVENLLANKFYRKETPVNPENSA